MAYPLFDALAAYVLAYVVMLALQRPRIAFSENGSPKPLGVGKDEAALASIHFVAICVGVFSLFLFHGTNAIFAS